MSFKSQTISGVKWTTVANVNNAIVQILKLMILARLLSKHDFGIINILLLITGFTEIFSGLGLAVGIINKKEISQKQYSSIFWINLIISILLYGIIILISPSLSNFYNESSLTELIPIIGVTVVINAFGKMFYTFKTKEMEFKFISIVSMCGTYSGTILTVILAFLGYGVYSLIYGTIFQVLVTQITYGISGLRQFKILLFCSLKEIKEILKIGLYQVGTQTLDFFSSNLDRFLIARFFGTDISGIYYLAKEFIMKVIQAVNPIITNVATPAFAKVQDDIPLVRRNYLKILNFLSSVNFPVYALLFSFSIPLVTIFYGVDKMAAAPFIQILSIWGLITSISNPASILIVSKGRTDLGLYWTIIRLIITSSAILFACQYDIYTVAWMQVGVAILSFFIYWKMMIDKLIQIDIISYIKPLILPFLLSVIPAIPFIILPTNNNSLYLQYIFIFVYGLAYVAGNLIFNRKSVIEVKEMIIPQKKKKDESVCNH